MRVRRRTHYDTLGVRPGDPFAEIDRVYIALMKEVVPSGPGWNSMKYRQSLDLIVQYAEAMMVLSHSDRRAQYDKQLYAQCLICTMCDGKGKVGMGEKDFWGHFRQFLPCLACEGTGTAEPVVASQNKSTRR